MSARFRAVGGDSECESGVSFASSAVSAPRGERQPNSRVAVDVSGVTKRFRVPHQKYSSVKERFTHPLSSTGYDLVPALHDVSFEVREGEFFGVVGRNGSGKSTLLRCIAEIYRVDTGRIEVTGSLAPFIELGLGFNENMSARHNAITSAVLLGMTRREARDSLPEIIAFAELEDFMDMKLKNFSSGMTVRLAFSIISQVTADVLLFDEVLAVGDSSFQEKCFDRFQRLKDQGRTILLVTHDMTQVERFCDRAVLLDRGETLAIGDPPSIARRYNRLNFEHAAESLEVTPSGGDHKAVEIGRAWFETAAGEPVTALAQGEVCCACVEVTARRPLDDPTFTLQLRDESHRVVFATSSQWDHGPTGRYLPGQRAVVRVRFENWLAPGRYAASSSVSRGPGAMLGMRDDMATLAVYGTRNTGGVVDLPHDFEVQEA